MNSLDFEVRFWIARYLNGDVALIDLRRWLLPVASAVGEPGAPDSRLVRRVEAWLGEYMNGHRSEDDLRSLLLSVARATSGLPAAATVSAPVGTGVQSALLTA
jgi:hypothetical protein